MSFFTRGALVAALTSVALAQVGGYQQCGGKAYHGNTSCESGASCVFLNDYYSQCLPEGQAQGGSGAGSASAGHVTTSAIATTTDLSATTSDPVTSSAATTMATSPSSLAPVASSVSTSASVSSAGTVGTATSATAPVGTGTGSQNSSSSGSGVKYTGVNIAGFDFGCGTDGTCDLNSTFNIFVNGTPSGPTQMKHFVQDTGFNAFRLPCGWQYMINDKLGGELDATNFGNYDKLVQSCLSVAELCIIDMHNYARWNGEIVGQGGPTNDQYADTWSQIATKYANESKIAFGIMNEPHDLDIDTWAGSAQAAVTAIRKAGASSQIILLPGTGYTAASTFVSSGSAAALANITNPDGTTDNLVFDVHKYLDSDNSGTNTECVTNNIDDAFSPLADWLRQNGRQAFNSETGGGNTASCEQYLCQQVAFVNKNSDVYLGYTSWAAGGFDSTYELVETPIVNGDTLTDQPLVKDCLAPGAASNSTTSKARRSIGRNRSYRARF